MDSDDMGAIDPTTARVGTRYRFTDSDGNPFIGTLLASSVDPQNEEITLTIKVDPAYRQGFGSTILVIPLGPLDPSRVDEDYQIPTVTPVSGGRRGKSRRRKSRRRTTRRKRPTKRFT